MVGHIDPSSKVHLPPDLMRIQYGFQATGRVVEEIVTGSLDIGDKVDGINKVKYLLKQNRRFNAVERICVQVNDSN